jgi:hypothetical protein
MNLMNQRLAALAALLLAAFAGPCQLAGAAPPVFAGSERTVSDVPARATPAAHVANAVVNVAAPAGPAARAQAAADAELDNTRGGSGVTAIDTRLAGQVNGNTAVNVQTGWNVIEGGSFANMAGIPIVVQNSGANVLIQNATVIQLQFQ